MSFDPVPARGSVVGIQACGYTAGLRVIIDFAEIIGVKYKQAFKSASSFLGIIMNNSPPMSFAGQTHTHTHTLVCHVQIDPGLANRRP